MDKLNRRLLGNAESLKITIIAILAAITIGCFFGSMAMQANAAEQPEIISGVMEIPEPEPELSIVVMEKNPSPMYDVPLDKDLRVYTEELCEELGVPAKVIYAMMYVESRFQADVVNAAGDSGLLQLSGDYADFFADTYGAEDLLDPKDNILGGVSHLASYLEDNNLTDALILYNCGPGTAAELFAAGVHSTSYTEEVFAAMEDINELPPVVEYYSYDGVELSRISEAEAKALEEVVRDAA